MNILAQIFAYFLIFLSYFVAIYFVIKTILMAISMSPDSVPYVPVMNRLLNRAEEALDIQPGDKVIDIGSGDGKVINTLGRRHREAQFIGLEIRNHLVVWSRWHKRFWLNKNVTFETGDVFEHDLGEYNKVYMYLTRTFLAELMPKLEKELPSGSRVVSIAFGFGDEFEKKYKDSYQIITVGTGKNDKIYIWQKP